MKFIELDDGMLQGQEGEYIAQVSGPETGWSTMMFKGEVLFAVIPPSPNLEEAKRRIGIEILWNKNGIDPNTFPE